MKNWPILTAIASGCLLTLGTSVKAQDVILSPEEVLSGANQLNFSNVGLRIKDSNIVTAFHGQLMTYVGDCPGKVWTGNATKDNVRFISYNIPPAKHLRVAMTNLNTCWRVFVAGVLRMSTNHTTGEEVIVFADGSHARDDDMIFDQSVVADRDVRSDDTKVANANIVANLGAGVDDGGLRDHGGHDVSVLGPGVHRKIVRVLNSRARRLFDQ